MLDYQIAMQNAMTLLGILTATHFVFVLIDRIEHPKRRRKHQ